MGKYLGSITEKEKEVYKKGLEAKLAERQKVYDDLRSQKPYNKKKVDAAGSALGNLKARIKDIEDPNRLKHQATLNANKLAKRKADPVKNAKIKEQKKIANSKRTRAMNQGYNATRKGKEERDPKLKSVRDAQNRTSSNRPYTCTICALTMTISNKHRHMDRHQRQAEKLKSITEDKCQKIERKTIPSENFKAWGLAHMNTISGSMVRMVSNMKEGTDPARVISLITSCGQIVEQEFTGIPAMDRGRVVESVAIEWYQQVFPSRIVEKCGFFHFPAMPLFASTPDMLITTSEVLSCGEAKCPISTILEDVKWIERTRGEWRLKKNHAYYDQIAMHLLCTQMENCDVIVYISPYQFFIRRYFYNDMSNRMRELMKNAIGFYCKNIASVACPAVPAVKLFPSSPRKFEYCSYSTLDIENDPLLSEAATEVMEKQLKVERKILNYYENRQCKLYPKLKAMEEMLLKLLGRDSGTQSVSFDEDEEEEEYDSCSDPRLLSYSQEFSH